MRLFQTSLSSQESQPESPFPIADDGYLYIMAWGQSNMLGVNPQQPNEPRSGDMTNPTNVWVPDLLGGWKEAKYFEEPFNTINLSNNIAICFCREMADKYGLKIRLTFFAQGGAALSVFMKQGAYLPGNPAENGKQYDVMVDTYGTFAPADIRPAALVIFHQFESGSGGTGPWVDAAQIVQDGYVEQGWALEEANIICGEIAGGSSLSRGPHDYANEDLTKRRCAPSDGLQQAERIHFIGDGYYNFGLRYVQKYEELIFGYTSRPVDYTTPSPTTPVFTITDITATDYLVTWQPATSPYGLEIVGYQIQTINGFLNTKWVDGTTLSARVDFTPLEDDTTQYKWDIKPSELVTVLAIDEEGRYSEADYDLQITVTP